MPPFDDASFDRVIAVNNFHIWPDRAAALSELRAAGFANVREQRAHAGRELIALLAEAPPAAVA